MPETLFFHWIPREGMETTEKPAVLTVKFGDGYEQRRPVGLNPQLKIFRPVFRVTDEISRRDLENFLTMHGGWRSFFWNPPKLNRAVRVVCREWSIQDYAVYSDFSCTFEQVVN
ncbi:TPA: phage tail protein [Escherichia coli]